MTKFRVEPKAVLNAAAAMDFASVVVVGRYRNGRLYVAGSDSTPDLLKLLDAAPGEIERLSAESDAA